MKPLTQAIADSAIEKPLVVSSAIEAENERVPARGRYDEAARLERLEWLEARTGVSLDAFAEMRLQAEKLTSNAENVIGALEIPVGLAGPLLFLGEAARGMVYAPLATTEGALIASAARGATAITRSGGVRTSVSCQRMTRAPAFEFTSRADALAFIGWVSGQLEALTERTREVSRHAVLQAIEPQVAGTTAHLLFIYTTGDAAGQNMTTATTWHACQWILEQLPALDLARPRFVIEGNASGDKKVLTKPSRGFAVTAECVIDEEGLRTLRVTAEELLASFRIFGEGARLSGAVMRNVCVSNIVAALFAATGQDIACVHESSLAEFTLVKHGAGVLARVTLPGLVLGTVGGGTHLPGQRACLDALGCTGVGSAPRLAEIVAGFALALELSTASAITTGEFAAAHQRLGRNRPMEPLDTSELVPSFFEPGLRRVTGDRSLCVTSVDPLNDEGGSSILGTLAARRFRRAIGVLHRRVHHSAGHTDVVVKVKPADAEIALMMQGLASSCGSRLSDAYARFGGDTGFAGAAERELAVYSQTDCRFAAHIPIVYDVVRDASRGIHALVLERLHGQVRLMDSADDPSGWGSAEIEAAVRGAGALHAIWLGRERDLLRQPWLGKAPTAKRTAEMSPLWKAMAIHASEEFPHLMDDAALRGHLDIIDSIPEWWTRIEAMPRTLAHNDFNPRNVGLREVNGGLVLCAYDWELATLHLPQHDVAELLAFVLPPVCSRSEVLHLVELHRRSVMESGARVPDAATWREGFALAARDLLINRFGLYLMAHTSRDYRFLERSLTTLRRLIDLRVEVA